MPLEGMQQDLEARYLIWPVLLEANGQRTR
jgi:hypothetical protein